MIYFTVKLVMMNKLQILPITTFRV